MSPVRIRGSRVLPALALGAIAPLAAALGGACSAAGDTMPVAVSTGTGGEDAAAPPDASPDGSDDADAAAAVDPLGGFDVSVEDGNRLVLLLRY